jgi:hypothetical protein
MAELYSQTTSEYRGVEFAAWQSRAFAGDTGFSALFFAF